MSINCSCLGASSSSCFSSYSDPGDDAADGLPFNRHLYSDASETRRLDGTDGTQTHALTTLLLLLNKSFEVIQKQTPVKIRVLLYSFINSLTAGGGENSSSVREVLWRTCSTVENNTSESLPGRKT